jgi:hypothetical protein
LDETGLCGISFRHGPEDVLANGESKNDGSSWRSVRDWLHDVNPVLTKHAATLEAVGVENTGLLRGLGEDGKRTIVRALADAGAEKVHIKTILAALDDVPEQKHDATSRPRMWHPRLALRPTDEIEWRRDIMPDDQQPSNHPQGKLQDQGRPLNATEAMLGNAGRKWAGATGADALLREKENWVHEPERKNPSFLASAVGCCAGSRDDSDDDDDTDVLAEVRSPGYACCAGGRRDFDDDTYPPPPPARPEGATPSLVGPRGGPASPVAAAVRGGQDAAEDVPQVEEVPQEELYPPMPSGDGPQRYTMNAQDIFTADILVWFNATYPNRLDTMPEQWRVADTTEQGEFVFEYTESMGTTLTDPRYVNREEERGTHAVCCCAAVLLCCCAAVLLCCCAAVLLCCCAAVLLCCCAAVLLSCALL